MRSQFAYKDRRSSKSNENTNQGRYFRLTTGAVPAFSLWNGGG